MTHKYLWFLFVAGYTCWGNFKSMFIYSYTCETIYFRQILPWKFSTNVSAESSQNIFFTLIKKQNKKKIHIFSKFFLAFINYCGNIFKLIVYDG